MVHEELTHINWFKQALVTEACVKAFFSSTPAKQKALISLALESELETLVELENIIIKQNDAKVEHLENIENNDLDMNPLESS